MLQKLRNLFTAKKQIDLTPLSGVLTFFGAHHALKGDAVLSKSGYTVALIPGPRKISPNCGTALRFEYEYREEIRDVLSSNSVAFEALHYYPHNPESGV